ncbi:putative lipase [Xylariaceae sp. FL0594]|nr:putative lipase [Xylariaceae sp. FL0594]
MKLPYSLATTAAALLLFSTTTTATNNDKNYNAVGPRVHDDRQDVTYHGLYRNGVEVFLGVPFGEDTSGMNRFKPPRAVKHARGTVVDATSYGPACPQKLVSGGAHIFAVSDVTEVSEDCLNLVIGRPRGATRHSRLPVMVWIHGGGFWGGQNREATTSPDGLVRESVRNGLPVVSVAINYRLGFFGFAQSGALREEGSENAGLRDQRLALEWVRHHIRYFGGDPDNVTIFGQSSGGLAVGMQTLAYGGSKPVPFRRAICESQCNEPGITGNFTLEAMGHMVDAVGCGDDSNLHSAETIACFRGLDTATLLNASIATYRDDIGHNLGDIWLPVVDGDFLPAAPSQLLREGRFANVTTMIGWCEDDLALFTDTTIATDSDARAFISRYISAVTSENIDRLFDLYPVSEFAANEEAGLSSQFYRTARIFRDILMVCQPLHTAARLAGRGNDVYVYAWNQTIGDQLIKRALNATGFGVVHTSEIGYVFGNLSVYNSVGSSPIQPTSSDYALISRGSRSWSTFATAGKPGLQGHDTFSGFTTAFPRGKDEVDVFIAGGPHEGLSAIDGPRAKPVMEAERLRERCSFLNSDEMIKQLQY